MSGTMRLPKYNEVFGENKKRIFKVFGEITGNSEYASALTNNDFVWALDPNTGEYGFINCVDGNGEIQKYKSLNPFIGIRACCNYSEMGKIASVVYDFGDGLKLVKYGTFPKRKCTSEEVNAIYSLKGCDLLKGSGRFYERRANSVQITRKNGEPEITFGKDRYFTSCYSCDQEYVDVYGNTYTSYNGEWYLVQPILWLVDEYENYAITEEIIAGGIPCGYCLNKDSTTKLSYEAFSIVLFMERILNVEIAPSYTGHIKFPSLDDPKYQFLQYRYPFLNGLSENMTYEEYNTFQEMIGYYQDRKDNYCQSHSFR